MTAPPKKAGDATTGGLWAFDRSSEWRSRYELCSNKTTRISPLNIDTNNVAPCNSLCRLSVNYKPSTCSISMVNNIPTVTFAPNSIIKFKNDFLYLRKMTIHYTSMHTVNNSYSDLEILLYHNRNPINDSDGGIILSILLKSGPDYGRANEFMNEFINRMPSNEMIIEQDIDVSDTWCPDQLFPEGSKSFFYYDGALPYPPCKKDWTFIIFEETVPISQNIIDTVKYILGIGNKNIRPIQRTPKDTVIFYNSNSQFDGTQDVSDSAIQLATTPTSTVQPINSLGSTSWLKKNIYLIKGIFITIILILMVYVAIKFAKVIVENDLLNSFIIRQLKKKRHLEAQASQEQAATQQAAEYGGVAPVENVSLNNNNNENNNIKK
jgi:carbonic anhydrase